MIIAVDFDGTLQLPDGSPNSSLFYTLRKRQRNGDTVILWTCREGRTLAEAVRFCTNNGLRFNMINQNSPHAIAALGCDSRKIYADLYIDDKAIR